jgi:hypothetical protein
LNYCESIQLSLRIADDKSLMMFGENLHEYGGKYVKFGQHSSALFDCKVGLYLLYTATHELDVGIF